MEDPLNGMSRPGTLVPAAALLGLLFFDVLRVWLPSLLFIVADAGSTSAAVMGAIAIAVALVAPVASLILWRHAVRIGWPLGIGLVLGGRVLLQVSIGGALQFAAASMIMVGAGLALGALGAGAPSGPHVRVGVLLGFTGSIVIHAGLGTTDLVWRDGALPWTALAVILVSTAIAARDAGTVLQEPSRPTPGAAWPWWMFGPVVVLLGVLTGVPGRVATATAWPDAAVVITIIVAHGLAVMAAVVGRWFGPTVAGTAGAGLVLFGTAGSIQASSLTAVVAQILLAVGLGFVVGAIDRPEADATVRHRAVAAAGFPAVFVLIGFAYYAGYDLSLPFPRRGVLLVASAIVAGAGLYVAGAGARPSLRERGLVARQVLAVGLATVVTAAAGAALVASPARPDPSPGTPGEEMTVGLYNIHMGFDPAGRMSIGEIGDVLAARSPDIVVLNEVDRGWLTTGSRAPLLLLRERLGMEYTFAPAADEVWGNAVLSRYPITEVSVERLPRGRDPMARSQLIVVLEVEPERRIAVVATHLSHIDVQGDTRLPQARAIAGSLARLQEREVPVILAGDLNAQPGDAELDTFGEIVRSAVPGTHPTYPSTDPDVQIDHLLVSDQFQVTDVEVPRVEASDHLPVFATLTLEEPPPDG